MPPINFQTTKQNLIEGSEIVLYSQGVVPVGFGADIIKSAP